VREQAADAKQLRSALCQKSFSNVFYRESAI